VVGKGPDLLEKRTAGTLLFEREESEVVGKVGGFYVLRMNQFQYVRSFHKRAQQCSTCIQFAPFRCPAISEFGSYAIVEMG
jgi:hypothetical protein